MHRPPPSRQATLRARFGSIVVLVALTALAAAGASTPQSSVAASAPDHDGGGHVGLPPGFTRLVDDTGAITVVVPDTWTDIDLSPVVGATGAEQPYIAASPNRQQFETTFDVPGVVFTAVPYSPDPQSLIDGGGLTSGCQAIVVQPYQDAVFSGLVQVGTACGSAATATWNMVVASPADAEFTAVVMVQTATPADQPALDTVLSTFDRVAETSAPPSTATTIAAGAFPSTSPAFDPAADPTTDPTTDPATDPEALPAGFVRLIDDTGTTTVVVPASWTEVETREIDLDGGLRRIAAAPDLNGFLADEDAAGVNFFVGPYDPDPEALLSGFERPDSCRSSATQPYDDGLLIGIAWRGEGCGPSNQGTWLVLVASPADQSATFRVHVRTANADDIASFETVLQTFGLAAPAVAAAVLPPAITPAGSSAPDVATAFLAALASGDGDGACSLLNPDYIGNFAGGLRSCGRDLAATVNGQAAFWASVRVVGDETTSSETCGEEDPADEFTSLELQGPADDGCLSMGIVAEEWRIEDLSNSIWNQA